MGAHRRISFLQKLTVITVSLMIAVFVGASYVANVTNKNLYELNSHWQQYLSQTKLKQQYLSQLHSTIGYGGFIHNFKNYVLRGEQQYANKASQFMDQSFSIIQRYEKLNLDTHEQQSLVLISSVLKEYERKLRIVTVTIHDDV